MLNRRNGIILAVLAVIVVGFALVKLPTPPISIAAEPVIDLGGYTITNTILSFWVIMIIMITGTMLLYRRLRNVDAAMVPRGAQNLVEALLEQFFNVVTLVAGERNGRRFFPVVASIFVILLFANWFGLFPWNNVVGKIVDERVEYLEHLEEDAEDLFVGLPDGLLSADQINTAYANFYLDPIPVTVDEQEDANIMIADLRAGRALSAREQAVREAFTAGYAISVQTADAELAAALHERIEQVVSAHPFSAEELDAIEADSAEEAVAKALLFNLPLPLSAVDESELAAAVVESGGVSFIPIKAEDFEFDPYLERLILPTPGSFADVRLFDSTEAADEENRAVAVGEAEVQMVTVNTAHIGVVLKREREGLDAGEGIGEIFPFFRSIATDLNLPLAIALWAFIFVQIWGIGASGLGGNFGKYVGAGRAAVVKGPIGAFVGFLEIISEIARIVSFTFRLFGNIFAGEILLFMTSFLVPFLAATVFYGLEVFVAFIQAFVFAMLTLVFAVTAVSHGEHHEEETGEEAAGP